MKGQKRLSECTHIKVSVVVYRVCVDTLYACVCVFYFFLSCLSFLPWPLLAFPLAGKAERRRAISIESVRAVAVQSLVRWSGPERDPSDCLSLSLHHSHSLSRLLIPCLLFYLQPENQLSIRRTNNYISDTESCGCSIQIDP